MNLNDVFSPGGILESAIPFYKYRDSQEEMASIIETAFHEGRIAALEAGTGIGKSFAYLVPSFLEILRDKKKRIVIATSTITLENQLFEKDIPLINEALGADIESAILFGRSNYLCIAAFKDMESEMDLLKDDDASDFARFSSWVHETKSGDLSSLKDKASYQYFLECASDAQTCKGPKCPYFNQCFFYQARKRAKKARIVVTNHHLFILDGKNRDERGASYDEDMILPQFDYVVLDEAHHLEKEAEKLLSLTYSYDLFKKSIDLLVKKDKGLGGKSKVEYVSVYLSRKDASRIFMNELKVIKNDLDIFDQSLSSILPLYSKENEILLDQRLLTDLDGIRAQSEELARKVKNACFSFTSSVISDKDIDDVYLSLTYRNIENLLSFATVLSSFFTSLDYSKAVSYFVRERSGRYNMVISPMDTGKKLNNIFFSRIKSVILSSATLTVGHDFSHFLSSIGLKSEEVLTARFDSPFNFKKNLMLMIPQDALSYDKKIDASYNEYAANEIAKAISMTGGGALVLFTSNDMLSSVTNMVKKIIPEMKILSQDGKRNRMALLDEFKKDKDSSLFATASFWEGIDAPGETLRLLIIAKLPFSPPTSPMMRAKKEVLEKDGKSSFMSLTLPEAVIKFKQGVGRLIRSESDKGSVLVLDGRLATKGYRRAFIDSIPDCYIPEDLMLSGIEDRLESFLY